MKDSEAAAWFKAQFQKDIEAKIAGTPFSLDLLTAIALQETGYLWRSMVKAGLSRDQILLRCVGDTIDGNGSKGRSAFPINKAQLLDAPRGEEMFKVARAALESIAAYNSSYAKQAENKDKFCRGFGLFQYDLQFFKEDPDYFLERRWA